jgi:hypothetical protein
MTCDLVKEVGDTEGLNGRPTGNAGLKMGLSIQPRPLVPICRSQLPCHHRQPVPHPPKAPQETAQLMKITPPLASVLLPTLREMRLVLPGLEESAREAVLDAVRDSTRHPMQSCLCDLPGPRRPIG